MTVSDELLALYESVKIKKAHKFIAFSLKEDAEKSTKVSKVYNWSIDERAPPTPDEDNKKDFATLVGLCKPDAPSFFIFDFAETKSDGRQIKKLVLIKYVPETTAIKLKTIYGASYQVRRCGEERGEARGRAGLCRTKSSDEPIFTQEGNAVQRSLLV